MIFHGCDSDFQYRASFQTTSCLLHAREMEVQLWKVFNSSQCLCFRACFSIFCQACCSWPWPWNGSQRWEAKMHRKMQPAAVLVEALLRVDAGRRRCPLRWGMKKCRETKIHPKSGDTSVLWILNLQLPSMNAVHLYLMLPVGTTVGWKVPEAMPKEILKSTELVMDWNKMELLEMLRLFEIGQHHLVFWLESARRRQDLDEFSTKCHVHLCWCLLLMVEMHC